MAHLVGFDQDPTAPQGMGTFHFDDGRQLYAHEPEMAASIQQPPQDPSMAGLADKGPDMRLAGPVVPGALDAPLTGDQFQQRLGGMNFAPPAAPPQAPAQPAPATGGGPAQPPALSPQEEALKYISAPVRTAPTKGGVIPKSQSQTVETEGLPYDQELAEQRADANINLQVAKKNTADTLAARSQAESLQAQSQLPALQKQAAKAQAEVTQQQDAYKAERAELDRLIQASQADQKSFNANHWFESKSTIGKIGSVLAQAMGAYAATLGHGENWAQKIINQQIDADIANQKAQIEAGKGDVNNALMKMKLRFGDMGQAESALKIAMGQVADTQALAYAKSTGSQDIINTWQEQVAQNQVARTAEEQKFMAGALGKRSTTQQATVVAPSAGGTRERTDAEQARRIKNVKDLQDIGALPDTSREGRALDMKQKAEEAKQKHNPAAAKVQEQLDSLDASLRNAEELDKLYAKPGILSPAERGRMKYLQDVSPLEVHKGLTGMSRFTETEGERYATAYGKKGETLDYLGGHRAALGALREDLARKKAQLQQQLASGVGSSEAGQGAAIQDVE